MMESFVVLIIQNIHSFTFLLKLINQLFPLVMLILNTKLFAFQSAQRQTQQHLLIVNLLMDLNKLLVILELI